MPSFFCGKCSVAQVKMKEFVGFRMVEVQAAGAKADVTAACAEDAGILERTAAAQSMAAIFFTYLFICTSIIQFCIFPDRPLPGIALLPLPEDTVL